jgi:preprotein translocase subunit SecE
MTSEIAERDEHENERRRRTGPVEFFKEVRAEGRKISWASRNETLISTIMVVVMVVVMALFFYLADSLIQGFVGFLLGFGR